MAICRECDREMSGAGTSCFAEFADWPRVDHWGDHPEWGDAPNCPDCNCPVGSYHHVGCDVERCSHDNQAIGCDACEKMYDPSVREPNTTPRKEETS